MQEITWEITKTDYDKAMAGSPYDLLSDSVKMGYGAYGAAVSEHDGKYYLKFEMGDSCD